MIFLLLGLFSSTVYAFESYPEYYGPTSVDILQFDDPDDINSEYQSDFITYLKPISWQNQLQPKNNFLDTSVGSLSSKRFMVRNRIQLVKDLNTQTVFKAFYIDESDYEVEQKHFVFELQRWGKKQRWGFAVEGEVSTRKAEDDIGIALLFRPNSKSQLRFFQRFMDFSRNERNEEEDSFRKAPTATGMVFRQNSTVTNFTQASIRIEPKSKWYFPEENQQYSFERYTVGFLKQWSSKSAALWSTRLHLEKKENTQSLTDKFQNVRKGLVQLQKETQFWIFGYHLALRDYENELGTQTKVHHLPYGTYKLNGSGEGWRFGLESTFFNDTGNLSQGSQSRVEYRLNTSYRLEFSDQSEILFYFTFDIDRFGSGETWEGGNIQFRTQL